MDVEDVSQERGYFQLLQTQKRNLQNAKSRKGQTPRRTKTRNEIIMQFMFRQMMGNLGPVEPHNLRSSFVPPAYHPSVAALRELKKTRIHNLTLETHHRGLYLLVRAVTPTDRMTAIMAVVEDEAGDVVMLQLYNQEKSLATDGRLVEGTVMVIKEPYLKIMADGDYGLRVDHLSDVRFLSDSDPLIPAEWSRRPGVEASATDWKTRGNDLFAQSAYHLAIDCYTEALNSSPSAEEQNTIRLNRALACLKTHQFDAALRDVEPVLLLNPSEKGLFRKSQALYHLQRFPDSCATHHTLRRLYPENVAAKQEFDRATDRLTESQLGKYPFKRLQREADKRRPPRLDRATYVGPVSVRASELHGRGLFTTEAVRAGDLLLCEKAFAHAFHGEAGDSDAEISLLMNTETQTMTVGTQAELISAIAQRLYKNPSLIAVVKDLYHGSYIPTNISEVDGTPVIDTFLIERAVSLNCFGCPISSRTTHVSSMKDESTARQLATSQVRFHSCGVWALASYINHSCCSNVRRAFIGDMMIVRATRDLPADTELTFWYRAPSAQDPPTKRLDLQHWGFECSCAICQDRHATGSGDLARRRKLLVEVETAFRSLAPGRRSNAAVARIERMISDIQRTYRSPAAQVPRLGVWNAYLTLAAVHATGRQPRKALEFALKTFESLGYVIQSEPRTTLVVKEWGLIMDGLVGCWMILCRAYSDIAPDLADQAERYARTTYKICVGEDETFESTYSRSSKRVDGLIVGVV
ncbi:hypothetical protein ASPACDRAFT_49254 [Aspergillus aculeatus ATCC 16872]|uniref:SET domain-containing protein n=1 Tax=Aspergillus aculeatus (strain ATCC 16872 / CBS 172.66 / WB 5094) TaxID=690307 RepID=A0A1L9X8Y1_ASPA1|nr:uncharacterized protein ASPACDRAFT_49254 [Aspergillus aculeatus ATCC 16872]OJK04901.1 hypothetical protein ASPACDRAFT_49254 [Aspergillus aculeatus ATCC 16872]